jgi:hypothetical protein
MIYDFICHWLFVPINVSVCLAMAAHLWTHYYVTAILCIPVVTLNSPLCSVVLAY